MFLLVFRHTRICRLSLSLFLCTHAKSYHRNKNNEFPSLSLSLHIQDLSIYLSIYLSLFKYLSISFVCLSVCLSIHNLSIYLSYLRTLLLFLPSPSPETHPHQSTSFLTTLLLSRSSRWSDVSKLHMHAINSQTDCKYQLSFFLSIYLSFYIFSLFPISGYSGFFFLTLYFFAFTFLINVSSISLHFLSPSSSLFIFLLFCTSSILSLTSFSHDTLTYFICLHSPPDSPRNFSSISLPHVIFQPFPLSLTPPLSLPCNFPTLSSLSLCHLIFRHFPLSISLYTLIFRPLSSLSLHNLIFPTFFVYLSLSTPSNFPNLFFYLYTIEFSNPFPFLSLSTPSNSPTLSSISLSLHHLIFRHFPLSLYTPSNFPTLSSLSLYTI
ncbi:unnamed protein product [Acanthosepion pharaonis]|uniref:Uncharacterized protein n=1 Tax=Acanthosepion pharaonis TaxID=158019 RepID=A0A812D8I2_ACAPH|nr:unnamed protein product [Sepia pharaonis]